MLGHETFRLRTPFEDLLVRIDRFAGPPTAEQRTLARRAMSDLRFGVEGHDPGIVATAQKIVSALDGGGSFGLFGLRDLGPSLTDSSFETQLLRRLEEEFERGRLVVESEQLTSLSERRDLFDPPIPPLPPAPRESKTHTFEVRFVDEVGKAISGIDAEFTADGAQTRPTNAAGVALLEGVKGASANVAILDPEALSKVLDPRWEAFRPGKPPKESNTSAVVFHGGELGPFDLKAEVPNTVVIKPPLGKLFVELWDKTGRVRHANRTYQITGPQSFEGTTDDDGRLLHEDVFPGDYSLSLSLDDSVVDAALLVVSPDRLDPQLRMMGAVPRVVLARLKGLFFDTNKSFLLPATIAVFDRFHDVYAQNSPSDLLIVGHADTRADDRTNDPLALERAENTAAFVRDDVDAWLKMYELAVPSVRRWGSNEDEAMMLALPDFDRKPDKEVALHWFQRTRGLNVDGVAGPKTRRRLIAEYMDLDGSSLANGEFDIDITTHGCGEHFPLDPTAEELDAAPQNNLEDQGDRRVELFFFDREFGIVPPPPGKTSAQGSPEYPEWRRKAALVHDSSTSSLVLKVLVQDPKGQPLAGVRVQVLQDGVVVRTRTSDAAGLLEVTGHDPSRPCELVIASSSPLVISGGREEDPNLALEAEQEASVNALADGCQVELADNTPFVPPELEGNSVLV